MKISTSASFVVATLALSSSSLAIPVPDSPDLSVSPRSANAEQFVSHESAIPGSESRRSLAHLNTRDTDDIPSGESKDASAALQPIVQTFDGALANLGLGLSMIDVSKEGEGTEGPEDMSFLSARQMPPAPASLPFGAPAAAASVAGVPMQAAGNVIGGAPVPASLPVGAPAAAAPVAGMPLQAAGNVVGAVPYDEVSNVPGVAGVPQAAGIPTNGMSSMMPVQVPQPGAPSEGPLTISGVPTVIGSAGNSLPQPVGIQNITNIPSAITSSLPVAAMLIGDTPFNTPQVEDTGDDNDPQSPESGTSSTDSSPFSSPDPSTTAVPTTSSESEAVAETSTSVAINDDERLMLAAVPIAGAVPTSMLPVGAVPTSMLPLGAVPTSMLPLGAVPTSMLPVGAVPTSMLPLGAVPVNPARGDSSPGGSPDTDNGETAKRSARGLPDPLSGVVPIAPDSSPDLPLPSGFAAPTAPIPSDTPSLLNPTGAGKDEVDAPSETASGEVSAPSDTPSGDMAAPSDTASGDIDDSATATECPEASPTGSATSTFSDDGEPTESTDTTEPSATNGTNGIASDADPVTTSSVPESVPTTSGSSLRSRFFRFRK